MIAKIEMIVLGPPLIRRTDGNKMMKRTWRDVGNEWHQKFRRSHFTQSAFSKYGYKPRSKRYNRFKRRISGHTLPLVFTGTSRRLSESKTIRATKKNVTVSMPIRVFNFSRKGSKVDKRREMTTVASSEVRKLNNNATRNLERRYRRYQRKTELV